MFPKDTALRTTLVSYFEGYTLPANYEMYKSKAAKLSSIPLQCQMYAKMGCSFVLNVQIAGKSKANWMYYINSTSQKIKNDYMKPLDDIVKSVADYTGPPRPHICSSESL